MASQITSNTFFTTTGPSPKTTIFFISGNPGLIAYYHPFLSLLAKYLKEDEKSSFQIYGCSLGGFEIGEVPPNDLDLDLEDQIRFVQGKLATLMGSDDKTDDNANIGRKVILIGHSVGSYIAMEVLRRHRESSSPNTFDITGGAMLFPTVQDIAASPSGQKLTVCFPFSPIIWENTY
jgi:pimeloyl-ACP methyl ester carboxylesterase